MQNGRTTFIFDPAHVDRPEEKRHVIGYVQRKGRKYEWYAYQKPEPLAKCISSTNKTIRSSSHGVYPTQGAAAWALRHNYESLLRESSLETTTK